MSSNALSPGRGMQFLWDPRERPNLSSAIIGRLIEMYRAGNEAAILAPTIAGKRGHPALFPWSQAAELFQLGQNEGLNAIVERHEIRLVACDDLVSAGEQPFADVDTPE